MKARERHPAKPWPAWYLRRQLALHDDGRDLVDWAFLSGWPLELVRAIHPRALALEFRAWARAVRASQREQARVLQVSRKTLGKWLRGEVGPWDQMDWPPVERRVRAFLRIAKVPR